MPSYIYSILPIISSELPAARGNPPVTANQVGLTKDTDLRIYFPSALSVEDKAALDLYMLDKGYTAVTKPITFHAPSTIIQLETAIINPITWQDLGGVVTTPTFFVSDANRILGQMTGVAKMIGTGAELRIIEDNLNGTVRDIVPASYVLTDDTGAWKSIQFTTQLAPSTGLNMYVLQGRLNGAISASLKFVSMSLLEIL